MAVRKLYKPEQEPMQQETMYGIVGNCTRLNVRKKPNRGSEVLTIIEQYEPVIVMLHKSTQKWYYVKTKSGVEGYCMADYVRKRYGDAT